jgi:Family of unknown function (DUF5908)
MPVEIKELTIKINLTDEGGTKGSAPAGGVDQEAQQTLVEAIADKVLAILRERQER